MDGGFVLNGKNAQNAWPRAGVLAAVAFTPEGAEYDSPGQRPGETSRKHRRSPEGAKFWLHPLLSRPFRATDLAVGSVPRALPWAFLFRPFGAEEGRQSRDAWNRTGIQAASFKDRLFTRPGSKPLGGGSR